MAGSHAGSRAGARSGARPSARGSAAGGSSYERIYAVVRRIPRGKVTTYGSVATMAGLRGQARLVGYALSALPAGARLPWHRVINAQGRLSLERSASGAGITQRLRLAAEGVRIDAAGRVSLARFGWQVQRGTGASRGRQSVPVRGRRANAATAAAAD